MSRRKRYTRGFGRAPSEALPLRGAGDLFVRFAHAVEPYGVFSYLNDAERRLAGAERAELDEAVAWFNAHLDAPARLVPVLRGRRVPRGKREPSALCWFRATAHGHVARARRMAILVRRAGIPIVERWSFDVPGQICSEDTEQIAVASFWVE